MEDAQKDKKMTNNKAQEVILTLHHRLVSLLSIYFTDSRWKINTHFDLSVANAMLNKMYSYTDQEISVYLLNWMTNLRYRNLHSHMKALSMKVNVSKLQKHSTAWEEKQVSTVLRSLTLGCTHSDLAWVIRQNTS